MTKEVMNDRIKELAEQAGYKPLPGFEFANSLEETYLEKFAKLVVQECAEFARQHNLQKADRSYMIHRAMGEHFGVEV